MHLLVVEDDPDLGRQLSEALTQAGYAVDLARDGEEGHFLGDTEPYDAVVLDLGLPRLPGLDVLRRARAAKNPVPILILTARDTVPDRIAGLDAGADDYMVKPFSPPELISRIKAVFRRIRPSLSEKTLEFAGIIMDLTSHKATRDGTDVHLSPTEFSLLKYLMEHPGRVFSREQLLDSVWGHDIYVELRTVDVHIRRLRKALNYDGKQPDLVRTVRSAGYALEENPGGANYTNPDNAEEEA